MYIYVATEKQLAIIYSARYHRLTRQIKIAHHIPNRMNFGVGFLRNMASAADPTRMLASERSPLYSYVSKKDASPGICCALTLSVVEKICLEIFPRGYVAVRTIL